MNPSHRVSRQLLAYKLTALARLIVKADDMTKIARPQSLKPGEGGPAPAPTKVDTEEARKDFKAYMKQMVDGWGEIASPLIHDQQATNRFLTKKEQDQLTKMLMDLKHVLVKLQSDKLTHNTSPPPLPKSGF